MVRRNLTKKTFLSVVDQFYPDMRTLSVDFWHLTIKFRTK